jgi:hypothetical protein
MAHLEKIITFDPPIGIKPEQRKGLDGNFRYYAFLCFIPIADKHFWSKLIKDYPGSGHFGLSEVCIYFDFKEGKHKPLEGHYGLYWSGCFDLDAFVNYYQECLKQRPPKTTL